ncbi:DUF6864 domain-containing function [Ruegeria sp. THAF33]|uniref:DUF6864 domain-containing function n=1 Tax=unclassified Ruegeria TaxID=2625375 RepID=UPI0012AA6FD6|nr:hypothetical protein FIU92_04895 [Ruegeria sp. THAF33]
MKVGKNTVIFAGSLLTPNDEVALFSIKNDFANLEIAVKFSNHSNNREQRLKVDRIDGVPTIELINWNNSLGTATTEPLELGVTKTGQRILFLCSNKTIGSVNDVTLQLMLEENKND